jgi:hypothetical protein
MDISYDLITKLPESNGFDSILTVVDRLTKMAHFIPCKETMNANELADVMIKNVWKLHGTPKTIVSDRGTIFVSQITQELDKMLGIQLHPSTAFHPRTDGQSEIVNKSIEGYLRHFVQYKQDDWEALLPTAEFAYNNRDHEATGVSPFKANYGFNPMFNKIPSNEQCITIVEDRLNTIREVQKELTNYLELNQDTMKAQFNKHVEKTPDWNVGDQVWLNGKNISMSRPSPKLDHRWLGPFDIISRVSTSTYKLKLPPSMKGIHPVFHVSLLRKHLTDTIQERKQIEPPPIIINGEEEYEVAEILDCRKRYNKTEYLVNWKGFNSNHNSWEPVQNLTNSQDLLNDFHARFQDVISRKKKKSRRRK